MIAIAQPPFDRLMAVSMAGPRLLLPEWFRNPFAHLKKGADGHLLKNAAGHLVKSCGALCSNCSSDSEQYQIVISGLVFCTNCISGGGASEKIPSPPTYVNGTWTVNKTATPCRWEYLEAGSFGTMYFYFGDTTCTSLTFSQTLTKFQIILDKISLTDWSLKVGYWSSGAGGINALLLSETWSVPSGDCGDTSVVNSQTTCPLSVIAPAVPIFSEDGGATITAI